MLPGSIGCGGKKKMSEEEKEQNKKRDMHERSLPRMLCFQRSASTLVLDRFLSELRSILVIYVPANRFSVSVVICPKLAGGNSVF